VNSFGVDSSKIYFDLIPFNDSLEWAFTKVLDNLIIRYFISSKTCSSILYLYSGLSIKFNFIFIVFTFLYFGGKLLYPNLSSL